MPPLEQPTTGLGSVAETNRLLAEASRQTGISAPVFSPTGAITSEVLSGPATPAVLPEPRVSGTAEALSAMAGSVAQQFSDEDRVIQEQEARLQEARKTEEKGVEERQSLIQRALGVITGRAAEEEKAGISELATTLGEARKQVTPAFNALISSQRAQQAELKALETANITDAGKATATRDINRKYAFEQADLSLNLLVARQGVEATTIDLQTAQSIVDRKVQLELEPIQFELDFTKDFLDRNRDILDKEENRLFGLKVSQLENARDDRKEVATAKGNLAMNFMKNGRSIPPLYQQRLNKAETMEEFNEVISEMARDGISLQDPLDRQIKIAQRNKLVAEAQEARDQVANNQKVTGEFGALINGAGGLVAGTKTKQVKANISNALTNENYDVAYAEIANAVEDSLTGSAKTKFQDSRTDYLVMDGMRNAIQQYVDAGGEVGLLIGTVDKIAKNFGQLANSENPELAALGVQLEREFQTYRLNMTGAAFSPAESREYAKVNPRTTASLDLNLATISGAQAQLENRITSTVNARLPDAKKIYNLAFPSGAEDITPEEAPAGSIIDLGGIQYRVLEGGLFEEI